MRIRFAVRSLLGACLCLHALPSSAADEAASSDMAARMAAMEARIMELESRLESAEEETEAAKRESKEAKVMAASGGAQNPGILGGASLDILASSAWRNLRWTQPEQWDGIRQGITEEEVIEALGAPPRSVKSLKPRVDEVFYYETSLRDSSNVLKGRVSFRDGKVIAFQKPDFK
jgi:hypothetical protein